MSMKIIVPDVQPTTFGYSVTVDFGNNETIAKLYRKYWLSQGTADFSEWLNRNHPDTAAEIFPKET